MAAGGALGAVARHLASTGAMMLREAGLAPAGWPSGTFAVNLIGGLAMGFVVSWLALRGEESASGWTLFLATGVLGGFTTFSAFSLELVQMAENRAWAFAAGYAAASVVLAAMAVMAGLWFGRKVFA